MGQKMPLEIIPYIIPREEGMVMRSAGWISFLSIGVWLFTACQKQIPPEPSGDAEAAAQQTLTAIPYYAWAHRGPGKMAVWVKRE